MKVFNNEQICRYDNGFFKRTINWDVTALAENELADGYIVQKILRNTEATEAFWDHHSDKEVFCHEYWEAWPVKNGVIVYQNDYDNKYDDMWSYGSKISSFNAKMSDYAEKLYTNGTICMKGDVYWLDDNDEREEILKKTFSRMVVEFAGELLSSETFDAMKDAKPKASVCFCSSWDFSTKEKFFDAVWKVYETTKLGQQQMIKDVDEFFSKLDVYEELKKYLKDKYKEVYKNEK